MQKRKQGAKDAPGTSAQGASANIIVNKPTYKGKGKGKMNYGGKPKKTTNFKKKSEKDDKVRAYFVCVAKKGILRRIAATARTEMMTSRTRR